MEFETSKNLT